MKRVVTIVVLIIGLLASIRYALALLDIRIEFNNDWVADNKPPSVLKPKLKRQGDSPPDIDKTRDVAEQLKPRSAPVDQPGFDVVRVDPHGASVFAGYARPNQNVSVLVEGQSIGTAKADANGNWLLVTERAISNPDADMSVIATTREAERMSETADAVAEKANVAKAETIRDVNRRMIATLEGLIQTARNNDRRPPTTNEALETSADQVPRAATTNRRTSDAPTTLSQNRSKTSLVPLPIQFAYREANFTRQGEKAAILLLEFLSIGKFARVELSGHADERGTQALNIELSLERLRTVRKFLRARGYAGALDLRPKGENEPFAGVDRTKFSRDELYQLDRRVELRFGN